MESAGLATAHGCSDGSVVLTSEQIDMLVEALLSSNQPRKGRRLWLVKMLGRAPCGQEAARATPTAARPVQAVGSAYSQTDTGPDPGTDVAAGDEQVEVDAGEGKSEAEEQRRREQSLLRRIGLVGCGEIGTSSQHQPREGGLSMISSYVDGADATAGSYLACLRACGGRVTHVHDADASRAAALASTEGGGAEGALVCASLEELLDCKDVAIVLNLTPVCAHARVSHACLLAGKHVWSEKPLAETVEEAQALVELARARGLHLGASPLTFWGEAQQTLARHLAAGLIGRPCFAQVDNHVLQ